MRAGLVLGQLPVRIGLALQQILELTDDERQQTVERLDNVLQEKRSL